MAGYDSDEYKKKAQLAMMVAMPYSLTQTNDQSIED